jgi:hypothetical protein
VTSDREIVSSNQKATGIFAFPNGCFAFADDELSGKLVFSGARRVSIGLSKSSSIHLSVKYLWLRVGNWAPLCLTIRMGATDSLQTQHHAIGNRSCCYGQCRSSLYEAVAAGFVLFERLFLLDTVNSMNQSGYSRYFL